MRVLITGAKGFTGRYVKQALEAHDHDVLELNSDLTDAKTLNEEIKRVQPEAVVHLAAVAFVDHGDANQFYHVNLIGSRNLLQAIHKEAPNIQSILLASSANVYGNSVDSILHENIKFRPMNDYAVSKVAMENMAALWLDRLPLFIVRPFNYTGIGQSADFLVPKIVQHFQARALEIELGNINVFREFNDVRMIAQIYRQLLALKPIGQTLNVCTGAVYSLQDIINHCQKITDHEIKIKVNPKFVRKNEVKSLQGDNARLKKLIPNLTGPTIEETLLWMLNENKSAIL